MDQKTETLFVYGTLLPGLAPAELLPLFSRLRSLGAAGVAGLLWDLGSYPGLFIDPAALEGPPAALNQERFQQVWSEALHRMSETVPALPVGGAKCSLSQIIVGLERETLTTCKARGRRRYGTEYRRGRATPQGGKRSAITLQEFKKDGTKVSAEEEKDEED